MWDIIIENLPEKLTVFCTILAYVIPLLIYKINQHLKNEFWTPWRSLK